MTLIPNRTEYNVLEDLPPAGELQVGIQKISVISKYWDHPFRRDVSILCYQEKSTLNAKTGEVRHREENEWFYDSPIKWPQYHKKTVWAMTWLPGVCNENLLQKVEEEYTTYWWENGRMDHDPSYRKITEGYAIYDKPTEEHVLSSQGQETLYMEGRELPDGTVKRIPRTAKRWSAAIKQDSVEKTPDVPQMANWEKLILEQQDVEDDFQKTVVWKITHDYLTGADTFDGPHETRKDNKSEMPLKPSPPELKGWWMIGQGKVKLELKGGGCTLKGAWPYTSDQYIPCDHYIVFRRVKDHFGAPWEDPDPSNVTTNGDGATVNIEQPVEIISYIGYGGAPVSSKSTPAPIPPDEPDKPEEETWDQVGEAKNDYYTSEYHIGGDKATMYDRHIERFTTYTYYAISVIGNESSDKSKPIDITILQDDSLGPRIDVYRLRGVTIDIWRGKTAEVRIKTPGGIDIDELGETVQFNLNAALKATKDEIQIDIDGATGSGYASKSIEDAYAIGRAIGARAFTSHRKCDGLDVTLAAPVVSLERGQYVSTPEIEYDIWTKDGNLKVQVPARPWQLEGFTASMSLSGGNLSCSYEATLSEMMD